MLSMIRYGGSAARTVICSAALLALLLWAPAFAQNSKSGGGSAGSGGRSLSTGTSTGAGTRTQATRSGTSRFATRSSSQDGGTRTYSAGSTGGIDDREPSSRPDPPDTPDTRDVRERLREQPSWGAENVKRQQNWDAYNRYAHEDDAYRSRFGPDDRDHDHDGDRDWDRDRYRRWRDYDHYYPTYVGEYWLDPYGYYYNVTESSASYRVVEENAEEPVNNDREGWEIVPVEEPIDGEFVDVFHPAVYRKLPDGKLEKVEDEKTTREPKVRVILTRRWVGEGDPPAVKLGTE